MASNAGRVLVINKGPWNAAASYLPMDEVFYDGSSYLCKAAVSSVTTPDKDLAHWQIHAKGATDEMIEHLEVSPYMRETLGELPTDIRDADTLGGKYRSGDIDAIDARVTNNTSDINKINSGISWKGVGTTTVLNERINLPTGWKELMIVVKMDGDYQTSIHAIKARLSTRNLNGWYISSSNYGGIQVNVSSEQAYVAYANRNGSASAFTAYVYYR